MVSFFVYYPETQCSGCFMYEYINSVYRQRHNMNRAETKRRVVNRCCRIYMNRTETKQKVNWCCRNYMNRTETKRKVNRCCRIYMNRTEAKRKVNRCCRNYKKPNMSQCLDMKTTRNTERYSPQYEWCNYDWMWKARAHENRNPAVSPYTSMRVCMQRVHRHHVFNSLQETRVWVESRTAEFLNHNNTLWAQAKSANT